MSLSSANSSLHRYQVMSPDQNSLSTMIGSVKFVDSTFLQLTITTFKFTQRIMRVKSVKRHSTWLIWIRVEEFISRITLGILSRWSSSSSSRHEKDSRQSCGTRIIFSLSHTFELLLHIESTKEVSAFVRAKLFQGLWSRFQAQAPQQQRQANTLLSPHIFTLLHTAYTAAASTTARNTLTEKVDIDLVGKVMLLCVLFAQ